MLRLERFSKLAVGGGVRTRTWRSLPGRLLWRRVFVYPDSAAPAPGDGRSPRTSSASSVALAALATLVTDELKSNSLETGVWMNVCVCVCVRACVRACVSNKERNMRYKILLNSIQFILMS